MFVKRIGNHTLEVPKKATKGSAAFDLQANISNGHITIYPKERLLIPSGFAWSIPSGFVGLVCPRSGMASNLGVTVINAPGVIDPDYRGEVKVALVNLGTDGIRITHGDRIAQMIITLGYGGCCVTEVPELNTTQRGDQGFGSTGNA